jgi:hypothetical protein
MMKISIPTYSVGDPSTKKKGPKSEDRASEPAKRMRQNKQTRHASLIEAVINTAVGFGINFGMQVYLFVLLGLNIPHTMSFAITVAFTGISMIRSFIMRRIFETLRVRGTLP